MDFSFSWKMSSAVFHARLPTNDSLLSPHLPTLSWSALGFFYVLGFVPCHQKMESVIPSSSTASCERDTACAREVRQWSQLEGFQVPEGDTVSSADISGLKKLVPELQSRVRSQSSRLTPNTPN